MEQNIALMVEYDGTDFFGWQSQENQRTVQANLEKALSKIAQATIQITCAGRTDRGVHAAKQVINFKTTSNRSLQAWVLGTNTELPADIKVLSAHIMPANFNARFSALARRYQYKIINQLVRPAIARHYLTWERRPLEAELMHVAGQYLLGEQDFSSFRSSQCQSSTPFRRIDYINVSRHEKMITIDIQANAFLHHMVRNIAGVLITIGAKEQPVDWIQQILQAKNRSAADITAPPNGLTLTEVLYPKQFTFST